MTQMTADTRRADRGSKTGGMRSVPACQFKVQSSKFKFVVAFLLINAHGRIQRHHDLQEL